MSTDIECPHCHKIQSDFTNGGDPGPWWDNRYLPEGSLDVECDGCGKEFELRICWEPNFYVDELDD